jgi:cell division protein FtsL
MTPPPPAASATAVRKSAPARTTREAPKQAPLKVVTSGRSSRGRRLMTFAPLAVVVCALIAVVVGQTMLANGQVRLSGVTQAVQQAQSSHRQLELEVSALEMPSRIVSAAVGPLHMVHPIEQQLPYVPLTTPLATPKVTPVPAPPAATTTATAGSAAAGSTAAGSATSSTTSTSNTQTPPQ